MSCKTADQRNTICLYGLIIHFHLFFLSKSNDDRLLSKSSHIVFYDILFAVLLVFCQCWCYAALLRGAIVLSAMCEGGIS